MSVGTKPGGHVHHAANGGVVFAGAAANRAHHHFADMNANPDSGACLSAETELQCVDHLVGGGDCPQTTVISRKPCNQRISYKLVDIATVLLHDLSLNAQHLVQQLDDNFRIACLGKIAELANVRKQDCH